MFIGRINQGQTVQALDYSSIFTLGLTGTQQLSGWPVSLVWWLSAIFLTTISKNACPCWERRNPTCGATYLAEYIYNARRIRTVTDWIIKTYSPGTECGPRR